MCRSLVNIFFFFNDTATTEIYTLSLHDALPILYAPELAERFPLLRQPGGKSRRVALVVITANRGLCGAFNANLIREARRRIEQLESEGAGVDLHLIGKKGITYFKFAKRPAASQRTDIGDKPTPSHAAEVVRSEEHTSELQSQSNLVCRLLL